MNKIYTKTGDLGQTSLLDGTRVFKNNLRCEAYGCIDELNSYFGLINSLFVVQINNDKFDLQQHLVLIQHLLFSLCSELAVGLNTTAWQNLPQKISKADIEMLEKSIDIMQAELPELKNFILPGGSTLAALLHIARTVCRRAERQIVTLSQNESLRPEIIIFVNRLSDWLFVAARWVNKQQNVPDILHKP